MAVQYQSLKDEEMKEDLYASELDLVHEQIKQRGPTSDAFDEEFSKRRKEIEAKKAQLKDKSLPSEVQNQLFDEYSNYVKSVVDYYTEKPRPRLKTFLRHQQPSSDCESH